MQERWKCVPGGKCLPLLGFTGVCVFGLRQHGRKARFLTRDGTGRSVLFLQQRPKKEGKKKKKKSANDKEEISNLHESSHSSLARNVRVFLELGPLDLLAFLPLLDPFQCALCARLPGGSQPWRGFCGLRWGPLGKGFWYLRQCNRLSGARPRMEGFAHS